MIYLKYPINFLFYLIKDNIIKSILIIASIFLFNVSGTLEDNDKRDLVKYELKGETESDYIYVFVKENDNKREYKVESFKEKLKLDENGYYNYKSYNEFNALLWVLFGLTLLWLLIATFDDSDDGWDFSYATRNALLSLVDVELESGTYIYMIDGRLLGKSSKSLTYDAVRHFNIYNFRDIKLCPKFETKTKKRNTILSKIGIN